MVTAREYLVDLGLAKPGRGKFSKVAHQALEKAIAEGKKFSDYPKVGKPAPVKAAKATGEPKPAPKPANTGKVIGEILFPDEYRYPEAEYQAVRYVDGKKKIHSMREICNNCRVSLVMCACESPTIYGSIQVRIVKK